jgi:TonB family protein
MDLVLPEWIFSLDTALRALVLRHEVEHRSARDPYLLFGAAVAVVLMPWNLALWWQARRLRLAVEMDCDARVLRADPRPERYGLLLMTMAHRRSLAPSLFAPMLSEPTTQLERRIVAMRTHRGKIARLSILGGAAACALALGVACSLQSPDSVTGPKPSAPRTIQASQNGVYFEFQVEKQVAQRPGNPTPRYPDTLRYANVEGQVLTQFVVDTAGFADMSTFKVLKESSSMFTAAVKSALPNMRFYPAEVGGRHVKQVVQMPFQFNLSRTDGNSAVRNARPGNAVALLEPVKIGVGVTGVRRESNSPARGAEEARGVKQIPSGPVNPNFTYFEFQVEKEVSPRPGNPTPRYPEELRANGVEGQVVAQFVVDVNGYPEMDSFRVLTESHSQFTQAVKTALPNMRFIPAEIRGVRVMQLVQMPFQFNLSKK